MKQEYWINVKHVDNRLVIYLNGETIWDSGIVHDDPALNKFIEITGPLFEHSGHTNELIFEGFNDDYHASGEDGDLNPWHFSYRVFKRTINGDAVEETELVNPYNEKHLSNPNTRAINNSYQLVNKNGEFKVIGNSLSQKFFK